MTVPEQQYVFRATWQRVVDGDTLDLDIDMGLHCHRIERVRLGRVNTPELRGDTKVAGEAAKEFVLAWLPADRNVVVQTYKSDVFGRYLAEVWRADGNNLGDDLLASGHAVPYYTH